MPVKHSENYPVCELSPEAVAKFAIENELRLIQSKLDRIVSTILYGQQKNDASHVMVCNLLKKLEKLMEKKHERNKTVRNSGIKRKPTLDKLQPKTDGKRTKNSKHSVSRGKKLTPKIKSLTKWLQKLYDL